MFRRHRGKQLFYTQVERKGNQSRVQTGRAVAKRQVFTMHSLVKVPA